MRVRVGTVLALALAGFSGRAVAQVPTRSSVPRLVVPVTEAPAQPTPGQPTAAPAPDAAAPAAAAPTATVPAAAAPDTKQPVTAVTGSSLPQVSGAPSEPISSSASAATGVLFYNAADSRLALGGVVVPVLRGVGGGTATAEVVSEKVGPDHVVKKHVGAVNYQDIAFSTTLDSKPLMDWVAASLAATYQPRDGSILGLDQNHNVRSEREFFHAQVREVTFPAFDQGSKDPAYLFIKIAPEYTRLKPGSGAEAPSGGNISPWKVADFRFEMTGLDGSKVSRIESFTIGQKRSENPVGTMRDYQQQAAYTEFPNLKISLPSSSAQSWLAWHDDFLIRGNSHEDSERDGAIVFLSPTQTELGRLNLIHCGIASLGSEPLDPLEGANSKQVSMDRSGRLTAELYCERMVLQSNAK